LCFFNRQKSDGFPQALYCGITVFLLLQVMQEEVQMMIFRVYFKKYKTVTFKKGVQCESI
jgi:hypothetical protein